jgi:hypothetical protein
MAGKILPNTLVRAPSRSLSSEAPWPPFAGVVIPGQTPGPAPWAYVPGGLIPHGVPQRLPQSPFPAPTDS